MPSQLWRSLILASIPAIVTGCVDRRFVVATNVPAAQVAVDGHSLGPAPVDGRWEYAGYYEFRASAPGYEPLLQREKFEPKWYDYPGLDFFAEVLWPFRIEDVRYVNLVMQPARPVPNAELQGRAEELRERSFTLPPPRVPDDPTDDPRPIPSGPPRDPAVTPLPPRVLPYQPIIGTNFQR